LKIKTCKIISVGNISVGGTGKTPVVKFLATYFHNLGFSVAVLSRGYGRRSKGSVIVSNGEQILACLADSGDEPLLLARQLNNIPLLVEVDRYKGALLIQKHFKSDIILLDDGFQHRRLHRDLDIVLIDASVGFGNGLLLPAGSLREPVSSLKRSDLVWLTRVKHTTNLDPLINEIRKYCSYPILKSNHQATEIILAGTDNRLALSNLNQKNVFLFSGIANPTSFERTVTNLGAKIVGHLTFSDHYLYNKKDINKICYNAKIANADLILTTEKDFVRIVDRIENLPKIYYLTIEIRIDNDIEVLKEKLSPFLKSIKKA